MKEAKHAVPETTTSSPSSSTVSSATVPEEFGANEWLVEEMYDRYQADPARVDKNWGGYFHAPGRQGNASPTGGQTGGQNGGQPTGPAPKREPEAKREPETKPAP